MDLSGSYEVRSPFGIGMLKLSCKGIRCSADMNAPLCSDPLHLYCVNGSKCVSLGVPVPENGRMRLRKVFDPALLKPLGGKIEYCILAPRGYTPEQTPIGQCNQNRPDGNETDIPSGWSEALSEYLPFIAHDCGALTGFFGGIQIAALPFGNNEFPKPSILKFGLPHSLGGRKYLLYALKGSRLIPLNAKQRTNLINIFKSF